MLPLGWSATFDMLEGTIEFRVKDWSLGPESEDGVLVYVWDGENLFRWVDDMLMIEGKRNLDEVYEEISAF